MTKVHYINKYSRRYAFFLKAYLNIGLKLNIGKCWIVFNECYGRVMTKILKRASVENNNYSKWSLELQNLKDRLDEEYEALAQLGEGENNFMANKTFLEETKLELLQLQPLKIDEEILPGLSKDFNIDGLLSEIREEVKKGNRASFKLFQELQSYIEEFSSTLSENDKEIVDDSLKIYEERVEEFTSLLIKSVDSMDLIYQALVSAKLEEWAIHVEPIIEKFVDELNDAGIEEVNTKGTFFDGEIMISIGTVSEDFAPSLERFQVYSVKERAFRFKDTKKLIRKATVITIY